MSNPSHLPLFNHPIIFGKSLSYEASHYGHFTVSNINLGLACCEAEVISLLDQLLCEDVTSRV